MGAVLLGRAAGRSGGRARAAAATMAPTSSLHNNVTRLLEARQIPFELLDLHTEEKLSGVQMADRAGVPRNRLYKTLVVLREKKGHPLLAVIPGDLELDLKALRAALGEKGLRMATQAEAEAITGLQVGGISALALLNRRFEVVLEETATSLEAFYVSAGQRGASVSLSPKDFAAVTRAQLLPGIARARSGPD